MDVAPTEYDDAQRLRGWSARLSPLDLHQGGARGRENGRPHDAGGAVR